MKNIGDPHGENHLPPPGRDDGALRVRDDERFVIVDLPEDFDIDQTFQSEQDAAEQPRPDSADRSDATLPETAKSDIHPDREPLSPGRVGRSLSIADLLDNHVRLE